MPWGAQHATVAGRRVGRGGGGNGDDDVDDDDDVTFQDKSSCLGAHSVLPLLGDEQDVVVVNPGSGLTPAHLAALLKDRKCQVVVVSEHNDDEHNKLLRNLELLGASKCILVPAFVLLGGGLWF